ncbi:MAG: homoserine dehydrogenase [Kiritimatiellia bacterium]
MKEIGVGIIGFGTVGAGVANGLLNEAALIARRCGVSIVLKGIADLDIETDRGVVIPRELLSTDAMALARDPNVPLIVELIGGTGIAYQVIKTALECGKSVVTANKKLLAEKGDELFALAIEKGADLYFGASVGGGIPIVRSLRDGLVANEIEAIYGILNGTCNYILTRMTREGSDFDAVLADAQRLGYAEANPSLDIDGFDTAHKISILASLAYGVSVPLSEVTVQGIRGLNPVDVRYADELGYVIKLIATCKEQQGNLEVRVNPTLVPKDHMLASVSDVFNAVMVSGSLTGDTLYYGKGAGRAATASTVISDVVSVARHLAIGNPRVCEARLPIEKSEYNLLKPEACVSRFYLRLMVREACGMVGQFATILGEHGVSIFAASQHEPTEAQRDAGYVPVVILTQPARTGDLLDALQKITDAGIVQSMPFYLCML